MLAESSLKHHAAPYWNPTTHRINVHPLGLVKAIKPDTYEAVFYDFVEPGEQVMIPWSLTIGGKRSALLGVAPQLRPLPIQHGYDDSDVSPITYNEWCAFVSPNHMSECCNKGFVWSETHRRTVCSKCKH